MAVQIDRASLAVECEKPVRPRIGRGTLRPTPKCNDLPPSPGVGEYPAWLIAVVEPGQEQRARAWLWYQSKVRTWLPTAPLFRARGIRRTRVPIPKPMVLGYLLVPALYIDHAAVLSAPGVHSYLMWGAGLVIIPDAAFNFLHSEEVRLNNSPRAFSEGDLVKIGNGIISNVIAEVERVDESGHACLWAGSVRIKTSIDNLDPA